MSLLETQVDLLDAQPEVAHVIRADLVNSLVVQRASVFGSNFREVGEAQVADELNKLMRIGPAK